MIKVSIIGTNGVPARYGGFETLAENLTKILSDKFKFTIYCSNIYNKEERLLKYNNSRLKYIPLSANGFQSFFYDAFCMVDSWFKSDVLIILGPAAGFIFPLNLFFKKKIIVNHGGLNEWEREKLNFFEKKIVFLNHLIAAKFSTYNVADNKILSENINKIFNIKSKVISYGGDHITIKKGWSELNKKYSFINNEYDLSISRAQEDNNLHILLELYSTDIKERNLVLISNWSISSYGRSLKSKYHNKYKNIIILDPIYDTDEIDTIRSKCSLYIHSHSRCGTAPSLVEAMSYNIPIICFDNLTNRETTNNKSLYFNSLKSLKKIFSNFNNSKSIDISRNLFDIAKNKYKWEKISNHYKNLIEN